MAPLSQLTLNIEPTLADRWPSLREFVAYRVAAGPKLAKHIAADLGVAPCTLSKKLNPSDSDTHRLTVDDLEAILASTGEAGAVIEYLASKYASGGDEGRKARALARVESLAAELERALGALRGNP